jgi:hypothetical protein
MLFTIRYASKNVERSGEICYRECSLWLKVKTCENQKPAKLHRNFAPYIVEQHLMTNVEITELVKRQLRFIAQPELAALAFEGCQGCEG